LRSVHRRIIARIGRALPRPPGRGRAPGLEFRACG
jgi:hypothetical protein